MGKRGGSSGKPSAGGSKAIDAGPDYITDTDWMTWAEDPEPFQAVLNGEPIPRKSQADGHTYSQEEISRIEKVAPMIQETALTNTVSDAVLYRGESFDSLLEAKRKYKIGKTVTNDKLTSYTRKKNIASDYAESGTYMDSSRVKVVVKNTSRKGRSVGTMTDPFGIGGSDEIITPKGLKSKVVSSRYDKKSNTLFVEMTNNASPKKKVKSK